MKKRISYGCFFGAVVIIFISQMQLAVVSQSLESGENQINLIDMNLEDYEKNDLINLPNFLDGTILDGRMKVIVTEDGVSPDFLDTSQYDIIISRDEKHKIMEDARLKFIELYGIDPYTNESKKSFKNRMKEFVIGPIKNNCNHETIKNIECSRIGDGPRASGDGEMILAFFIAKDSSHKPLNPYRLILNCVLGWRRFNTFNIKLYHYECWGYWDASDVGNDASDQLFDFYEDYQNMGLNFPYYVVNMGLTRYANHNGIAFLNSYWCIVTEHCTNFINIDKDRIAQHELTHCIGNIDDDPGWWPWDHGWRRCVVNYFYLFFWTDYWCEPCSKKLYNEIWNIK